MARSKEKPRTAVELAAQALRKMAMAAKDGALLGSEDDLVLALGVSRPTLRQAAAHVSQEHLITVRRGVGGGYFASSPSSMAVARMAAIYLQKHKARLDEIIGAVAPIRVELARLATRNIDDATREELGRFLERERALAPEDVTYRIFLKGEREFAKLLGVASANSVLTLFLAILYDFVALHSSYEDVYVNRPERVERYRAHRNRMAEEIQKGDEEMAVVATRRCSAVVTEWIREDVIGHEEVQIGDLALAGARAAP
jgi:DNA-binding FadR family transcriptional regulator